ncbi:MAG TPA: tetratricopeptide repeat protein, partial [Candidatus Polarisedimenticolaceae bacterium]|nr:tetratricopeptide repeat protein [Candidatus Polarisedimenticolaceae bacterium]
YGEVLAQTQAGTRAPLLAARASDGLGDVARAAGRWSDAESHYAQAAELWQRLLGETQPRLAVTLHNLGAARLALGRLDEAEAPLRRAVEIFTRALGPDAPDTTNARRSLELWQQRRSLRAR